MTARNSFELGQARYYHRPDAPAHIDKGCPHDVPSVTTILNALAKPALVPWAAGAVAREAIASMRAGLRGRHQHVRLRLGRRRRRTLAVER